MTWIARPAVMLVLIALATSLAAPRPSAAENPAASLADPGVSVQALTAGWPTTLAELTEIANCNRAARTGNRVVVSELAQTLQVEERVPFTLTILPGPQIYTPRCIVVGPEALVEIRNLDTVTHTPADFLLGKSAGSRCFDVSLAPGRVLQLKITWHQLTETLAIDSRLLGEPWTAGDCAAPEPPRDPLRDKVIDVAPNPLVLEAYDTAFTQLDSEESIVQVQLLKVGEIRRIPFRCTTHDFEASIFLRGKPLVG